MPPCQHFQESTWTEQLLMHSPMLVYTTAKKKAKVNKGKIYLKTHYNQRGKMFLKFS